MALPVVPHLLPHHYIRQEGSNDIQKTEGVDTNLRIVYHRSLLFQFSRDKEKSFQYRCMGIKMEDANAREALVNRKLPEMVLSDGTLASLTAPPLPMPHYLNAEGRAMKRFAVEGNAIGALTLCSNHL